MAEDYYKFYFMLLHLLGKIRLSYSFQLVCKINHQRVFNGGTLKIASLLLLFYYCIIILLNEIKWLTSLNNWVKIEFKFDK